MQKLLYQFDTDPLASVFDNVVAHDGGADRVIPYASITPQNVGGLVEGAIFTRGVKDKKYTALFVGGSDLAAGEALAQAIRAQFFGQFRVSVMLDSNGANTTAAACVAWLSLGRSLQGMKAVILGGTGPVGQRVAVMLTQEGAEVTLVGRQLDRTQAVCDRIEVTFGLKLKAQAAATREDRAHAVEAAQIIVSTGASGVSMLAEEDWARSTELRLIADANASPPLGIAGIEMADRATPRQGALAFGPLGFGPLKLAVHRAAVARLFESNDQWLDAEQIYQLAKALLEAQQQKS